MSCFETLQAYAFRSLGYGERLLPRSDFTLCEQFVLIGSGLIWNVYFGVIAIVTGFFFANALAMAKNSPRRWLRSPANGFIFVFRGSPLFIQFFFAYFLFLSLKSVSPIFDPLSAAWLGALIVLFLNTSAYSAEIFYGALRSIPKGDIAAAMERAFAEAASETEGFDAATVAKTTRWLPDGMVFAGATEAGADTAGAAPETEEGDLSAEDSLSDAESDEPSSLPAFLSGDAA